MLGRETKAFAAKVYVTLDNTKSLLRGFRVLLRSIRSVCSFQLSASPPSRTFCRILKRIRVLRSRREKSCKVLGVEPVRLKRTDQSRCNHGAGELNEPTFSVEKRNTSVTSEKCAIHIEGKLSKKVVFLRVARVAHLLSRAKILMIARLRIRTVRD